MNRRRALVTLAGMALLLQRSPALASESMQVKSIRLDLSPADGALLLGAEFAINLSHALQDAVSRGLPLHFVTEFEIIRPRTLWLDDTVATGQKEWRLSYHALTRQYRVSWDKGSEAFNTLDEALALMLNQQDWAIASIEDLKPERTYLVRVRMRLDTTRLPKPFQITAFTDSDWNPQSAWKGLSFVVPTRPTPEP
ncbi:MAG: DUF4390 domain-containing protein [Lautropia sp.]|nr:DUF4390 domain-containing protein [Lautropia sp.]